MQKRGSPATERMRERNIRLNPFKPESFQQQCLEKRGTYSQWMNCRTEIMHKAGQSQFGRTRAAADCGIRFAYKHRASRPRQRDCSRKAIRPGPDNHGIIFNRHVEKGEPVPGVSVLLEPTV